MHQKLLYVIGDGGHVRYVERSADEDFVTIDRAEHAGAPMSHHHHKEAGEYAHADHVAFAETVAKHAADLARQHHMRAVVVCAPQRLVGVLAERIAATMPVAGEVAKDLTKVPDHELAEWLGHFDVRMLGDG
jgi:protein required for attachment to host cells